MIYKKYFFKMLTAVVVLLTVFVKFQTLQASCFLNSIKQFGFRHPTAHKLASLPAFPLNRDSLTLPSKIDLRVAQSPNTVSFMPFIYDQGNIGSCTANAGVGCIHYKFNEKGISNLYPSRRFLYWWERSFLGTTAQDSGAHLVDVPAALMKYGICHEEICPYGDGVNGPTSLVTVSPSDQAIEEAATNKFKLIYGTVGGGNLSQDPNGDDEPLESLISLKTVLAGGTPVAFGFSIYPSFLRKLMQVSSNGDMSFLSKKVLVGRKGKIAQSALEGHAIMVVGYDDSKNQVIIRNSWGTNWGDQGYAYMPQDFLTLIDQDGRSACSGFIAMDVAS